MTSESSSAPAESTQVTAVTDGVAPVGLVLERSDDE